MQLAGYFLFATAGIFCLWVAYYYTKNLSAGQAGLLLARGFIINIQNERQDHSHYILTVNFTAKGGRLIQHQEKTTAKEDWYKGMPVLIRYCILHKETKVLQILSYRKAYAKPFILSLLAILLIISGVLLL